ncbi:hypothetical protein ACFQZC_20380 [Streptacidiphilus monticola]
MSKRYVGLPDGLVQLLRKNQQEQGGRRPPDRPGLLSGETPQDGAGSRPH